MRVTGFLFGLVLGLQSAQADPLPSAPPLPGNLAAAMASAPPLDPPRTRYLDQTGAPVYRNRLILERSPYLRQHAHNPVDWHSWGDDAFAEAKARDALIFLSVGYATCHWCHVMEEESFDNSDVAAALNAGMVSIKVDRETLPEIDAQYMLATQLLRGSGGWPNNLFLTPDGQPIVAFGYLPPGSIRDSVIGAAADWKNPEGRQAMLEQAASVSDLVSLISAGRREAQSLNESVFSTAEGRALLDLNPIEGGFGHAPKFPEESKLRFLFDRYYRTGSQAALEGARITLNAIVAGGIHDHVGGGFHRYAVDRDWRTPHFEKMLYNQGQIVDVLVDGYELTRDPAYARATRRALDYLLRDMRAPGGGFYAAQDADSKDPATGRKGEGNFYVWTYQDVSDALGPALASSLGMDAAPTLPNGLVIHLDPARTSATPSMDAALERLRVIRETRPKPITDTKIISGWNGLAISAFAKAGVVLDEPRYIRAAEEAAGFVLSKMRGADGALARAYAQGPLETGTLRDYAWLGLGLVALHDSTSDARWLDAAYALSDQLWQRFDRGPDAPLSLSETSGPLGPNFDLIEGGTTSGNAAALELFGRLSRRGVAGGRTIENLQRADLQMGRIAPHVNEAPEAYLGALVAAAIAREGETGSLRTIGRGAATAAFSAANGEVHVDLSFAPGWHANAHRPLSDNLIGTTFGGVGVSDVRYPSAKNVTLRFQAEPLAVIDGEARLSARAAPGTESAQLEIQVCSDDRCLAPEVLTFRLPNG